MFDIFQSVIRSIHVTYIGPKMGYSSHVLYGTYVILDRIFHPQVIIPISTGKKGILTLVRMGVKFEK